MLKHFFTFSGITLISRIFGYARDILTAWLLGANILNDLFIICFRLPNLFRSVLAEGAINSAFIPIYNKLNTQQKKNFIPSVALSLLTLTLALCLILFIFMPNVIDIITPGLSDFNADLAIKLSRISIFYIFFITMAVFFCALLNIKNHFAPLAFLPIILNGALILAFILCWWRGTNLYLIFSSIIIAGIIQSIFTYIIAKKHFTLIFKGTIDIVLIKKFFHRLLPTFMIGGCNQLFTLISQGIASFFIGGISLLYYADRIIQLPLAIIGVSIANILLPSLSKNTKDFKAIDKSLYLAIHFAIPATIGCLYLSTHIIQGLFGYGEFTIEKVQNTANLLQILSLAIIPNIFTKILSSIFFANDDTKTPFNITICSLIIHLATTLYLVKQFGLKAIAIGTVAAGTFTVLSLLSISLKNKYLKLNYLYLYHIAIAMFFSALMLLIIILLEKILYFHQIVNLLVLCASGFLVYSTLQILFNKKTLYE